MYLSLVEAEKTIKNAETLNNPYAVHQILWDLFGDYKGNRPFLFRVDMRTNNSRNWNIYILSEIRPQFDNITKLQISNTNSKIFEPLLNNKLLLKFYVRVNPTIKKDKKRHPIFKEEKLIKWINNKGTQHGFNIKEVLIKQKNTFRSFKKGSKMITHYGVDFVGVLEISDKEQFLIMLKYGIGPAKAFGFGLMNIMLI